MAKILEINTVASPHNSVGSIIRAIAKCLRDNGHTVIIASGRGEMEGVDFRIGDDMSVLTHAAMSRLFDSEGRHSRRATRRFIDYIEDQRPDVIHLHNLHGHYLNLPLLAEYLRRSGVRVVLTMHDVWCITGHCASYDHHDCAPWLNGCNDCRWHRSEYPVSWMSCGAKNLALKTRLFEMLPQIEIVVPSQWMASQVAKSHLAGRPVTVVPNGVDTEIFNTEMPLDRQGVIAVANRWDDLKGLDDVISLAESQLVDQPITVVGDLLGRRLPKGVRCIRHITDRHEMATLYRRSAVLFNPSRAESYGMVPAEALACGCAVVANERCKAAVELLSGRTGALLVDTTDAKAVAAAIGQLSQGVVIAAPDYNSDDMARAYTQLLTR